MYDFGLPTIRLGPRRASERWKDGTMIAVPVRVTFGDPAHVAIDFEVEANRVVTEAQLRNLAMEMLRPRLEALVSHADSFWIDGRPAAVEAAWGSETFTER